MTKLIVDTDTNEVDESCPKRGMFPLVRISLNVLRFAAHASLFFEAQRLLLRIIRPVRRDYLQRLERQILGRVKTPLVHRFIETGYGTEKLHILDAPARKRPASLASSTLTSPSLSTSSSSVSLASLSTVTEDLLVGYTLNAPVAVLLHGHSMCATYWYRNIDDFSSLGYRVLAVDLLGWGRSSRPHVKVDSADCAVEWYVRSLHGALSKMNLGKILLVGHSLGGYVSLEYTRRYPEAVRNLILISPAACTSKISLSRALYFRLSPQRMARRGGLLGFLLFLQKYPRLPAYMSDRLRDYTYYLASLPPGGERMVLPLIGFSFSKRSFYCTRPLVDHLSPKVSTPVQIIVGERDSSMPVESVHQLYAAMTEEGYNVQLHVVDDSDHCPQLEQPKAFFDFVAPFVELNSLTPTLTGSMQPLQLALPKPN